MDTRGGFGSGDVLGVLGATAPARDLTANKTAGILHNFGGQISGFVITGKNGEIVIVDKSACRWLKQSEMWWLMHESNELPPSTPNEKS